MIALFNEHIRDYWSILENESIEYGIWPGLLSVLKQEFLWVITVTLTVTLLFWLIRRMIFKKPTLAETLGIFLMEQIVSLIGASIAAVIGAILVGSSFIFAVTFHSPISLDIGRVIEIVASALLLFGLFETVFFFLIDLGDHSKKGALAILTALPISWIGLWLFVRIFTLEVNFSSDKSLPDDFQIFSYSLDKSIVTTDSDKNGEGDIYIIDQFTSPGITSLSSKEDGELFWSRITPDNYYQMSNGNLLVPRTLYFAGKDIVPNVSMNGFFHKRPDKVELDWTGRVVELSYRLSIESRVKTKENAYTLSEKEQWQTFNPSWYEKTVIGPSNGGWGITIHGKDKIQSYTILATSPPKLVTIDDKQNRFERHLPEGEPINKLSWHRQYNTASLWINDKPAYYMSNMNPTGLLLVENGQKSLQLSSRDFLE